MLYYFPIIRVREYLISALSLESAPFGGGRLTPAGVRYHVTDHLGSVVAVSDGSNSAFHTQTLAHGPTARPSAAGPPWTL